MVSKKECVAMLLAGGQGSRLYALTQNVAKPAVPFGAKYRIIDFTLSNCINSGIDTVGVLTQYQPLVLNDYIGNGQPWDLDSIKGGVHILPPYEKASGGTWYSGTANAIYQNISFVDRYDPEYVVILSGDHIYKMDYNKMLTYHKTKGADATIAVLNVPIEEASRFGIMITDNDDNIIDFEEKPAKPRSTLASMGIYIFNWKKLKQYLIENENDETQSKDFGKNIIPNMKNAGEKLVAYRFDGYWKDVGTIKSLWDANMDLINPAIPIELEDESWKVYSRNPILPPQIIGSDAAIRNSMVTEGCCIDGVVDNSMISEGVKIGKKAVVKNSVLMPGVSVGEGAVVVNAIVGENTEIKADVHVGEDEGKSFEETRVAVVGHNLTVSENVKADEILKESN